MMSKSASLIEVEDILTCILTEWLPLRDRVRMDLVLNGASRTLLHTVLRRMAISPPLNTEAAIQRMGQRQIHRTSGAWLLSSRAMKKCAGDPITRPVLQQLEHLELHCTDPVNWNQFAACPCLKSLRLFNIKEWTGSQTYSIGGLPLAQPILSQLEKIRIGISPLTADMVAVLSQCERLVDVQYSSFRIEPLGLSYQAALWPYFQRMQRFHFLGDLNKLTSHFPERELNLVMLRVEANSSFHSFNLNRFLHFCPQLTDLKLGGCRIAFDTTILVICTELKLLERLHLDDCEWAADMPTAMPSPSEHLQTLWISARSISNAECDAVLQMLAPHVRNLTLSMCNFPSNLPSWVDSITQQVPKLQTLTVDYEQRMLSAAQLKEVEREFGHLARLKVTSWRNWWSPTSPGGENGKTVMLDISK